MENFANLNGNGNFVLRLNDQVAQTISFTPKTKDAIEFDFSVLMTNPKFADSFRNGRSLKISIGLENFVAE
jgi:hypothetical protein